MDEEQYQKNENNQPPSLDKRQKIAVGGLAVFAVLIVGMWMIQFQKNITQPFTRQTSTSGQEATCASGNCKEQSQADLMAKDTDGDGLNDWEEFNTYNTSPYLEDSDSDGFSDKDEIDSDNDPNCPTGRNCSSDALVDASEAKENDQQSSLNTLLKNMGYEEQAGKTPDVSGSDVDQVNALLSGEMDAASLRQLLLANGMQKEILDQVSDEELMKSFSDLIK